MLAGPFPSPSASICSARPIRLQPALNIPNIIEGFDWLRAFVPARIESQNTTLKHTLKKANKRIPILHDQIVSAVVKHGRTKALRTSVRCSDPLPKER
jgi:hypothetical protein